MVRLWFYRRRVVDVDGNHRSNDLTCPCPIRKKVPTTLQEGANHFSDSRAIALHHIIPPAHAVRAHEPVCLGTRAIRGGLTAFQFLSACLKPSKSRCVEFFSGHELIGTTATRSFENQTAIGIDRACSKVRELVLHFGIYFFARIEFRCEDIAVTPAE
jgi:hypothetical protein